MYTARFLEFGPEVVVPDPVVDRRVVEHDPGIAHEQLEQLVLRLAELELAVAVPRTPAGRVDAQVAEPGALPP